MWKRSRSHRSQSRRPEFPSGSVGSGLAKLRRYVQLVGMASALLAYQMNRAVVISSLLIYVTSRATLLCIAQAPPRSISSLEVIPLAMIRQKREHRSNRSSKQELRGGANLCCRDLARQ